MRKNEIRNKLTESLNNSISTDYNDILLKCKKKEGKNIMKEKATKQLKNKKHSSLMPKLSFALALVVLTFGVIYFGYNQSYKVDSIIELDVNPSIEIEVNKKDEVIKVSAKNEDAKKVLEDMDLERTDIDVTLNAIIGSMVTKGYIDDLANSILVSVENDDKEKGEELRQKLAEKINTILGTDKINGSVLSQTLEQNEKATSLAEKYNISLGKANLILDVLENNKLLKEKDLVNLSINELNVLLEGKAQKEVQISKKGQASTKAYIGKTKAKQVALNHAGVSNPKYINIDFDADDGIIVYEVEFDTNNYEYDYEINAKTGKILNVEKEKNYNSSSVNSNYDDDDYDDDYDDDDDNYQKSKTNSGQTAKANNYITAQKARQIACNHAGASNPSHVSVELDKEDNEYSVEFQYNGKEYDYEINATTGSIKDYDSEKIDND